MHSISFSEFIDYVVAQPPESLDPHWCPQYLYLRSAVHQVFRLQDLDEVATLLGYHAGIQHRHNATRNARRPLPGAYRLAAYEIPHTDVATESFYNARIRKQVESYYALDFTLVEAAARALQARHSEVNNTRQRYSMQEGGARGSDGGIRVSPGLHPQHDGGPNAMSQPHHVRLEISVKETTISVADAH